MKDTLMQALERGLEQTFTPGRFQATTHDRLAIAVSKNKGTTDWLFSQLIEEVEACQFKQLDQLDDAQIIAARRAYDNCLRILRSWARTMEGADIREGGTGECRP